MNALNYPVFCLNGKSYAFLRYLDNTRVGLTALKKLDHVYEYTYSVN